MKGIVILATVLCVAFVGAAYSQHGTSGGYPKPQDRYVNDFASIIDAPDAQSIQEMFRELHSKTGIHAVVVTINSISDYGTSDANVESFATMLFNTWGIGSKSKNDGILMLVAKQNRKVRIEMGSGFGQRYNAAMKQVIDTKMVPYFKTGNYSRGIFEGARGVVEAVTVKVSWFDYYKWHLLITLLVVACIAWGISLIRSGRTGWGWVLIAAAGALIVFLISLFMRGGSSDGNGFGGGSSSGDGASGDW